MQPADKRKSSRAPAGFTLVEVLVALALMAVVIPVVMQALHLATLAGEVSRRKALAARVAEKVLNETIVTGQWNLASQNGVDESGQYRWTVRNEPWTQIAGGVAVNTPAGVNMSVVNQNTIHQLSVDVTFSAQSQSFAVHLSTLVNVSQQPTTAVIVPPQ